MDFHTARITLLTLFSTFGTALGLCGAILPNSDAEGLEASRIHRGFEAADTRWRRRGRDQYPEAGQQEHGDKLPRHLNEESIQRGGLVNQNPPRASRGLPFWEEVGPFPLFPDSPRKHIWQKTGPVKLREISLALGNDEDYETLQV